ncbi:MAG: Oligopeptide ABC transporter, periplasmic oligopeptide-binding protein OppA [uncultured Thermomicrobiales bacterium]|uniref:Oligopeptide ABC transporter, periplasmic oligopeptide-binding protein OppA n=1 Tax=uncultured Thermomicrobiales bacterium TaxID=1645740 RepID=A0A6J4VHA7_9BACT|nr:MAG: Oligopeptide ABC transporter, periplasmic oligopeptide-binding protein OppA [uncultured Thermomicrobiales bacterium]
MTQQDSLAGLVAQLGAGQITRRDFIARGMAIGVGASMLGFFIRNAQTVGAAPHPQDATPAAPAMGLEGKTRGQDGELKLLMWQAPTHMSPQVASGTKDYLAGALVVEPLINYLPDGTMYPKLLSELPSIENGGLAEDLTSATLRLLPDVVWSDGTPFTAADVVFTWEWIIDPAHNATNLGIWSKISGMTAVDDLTVEVTYPATEIAWYEPLAGLYNGAIYPKHYIEANGGDGEIMRSAPIGTGPYVVDSFAPNDQIIYSANPMYRDPNKPAFASVNMKGGGEPVTVAQSVLETGDWDYAWNVVIEPDVVMPMEEAGNGSFRVVAGTGIERINFNFSDPRVAGPEGQLSYYENPHPIFSDPAVRQAINLAIDRDLIVERFYDPRGERVAKDLLNGIPALESPNTTWTYDADQASQILEDAGWVMAGDVREKDGVRLEFTYTTTINSVRQKTQQVAKQNLEAIGFAVTLAQTDSAIFFDSAVGNAQNLRHMYHDANMFTTTLSSPAPISFLESFYAGADRTNIAQQSNGWAGPNTQRYINPEYDVLFEQLTSGTITDVAEFNALIIQMNDLLVNDHVAAPLINIGSKYCMHRSMIHGDVATGEDNTGTGPLDGVYWNITNWNRSEPVER